MSQVQPPEMPVAYSSSNNSAQQINLLIIKSISDKLIQRDSDPPISLAGSSPHADAAFPINFLLE